MLLGGTGDDFRWYVNMALNNLDSHCNKVYFIFHFLSILLIRLVEGERQTLMLVCP